MSGDVHRSSAEPRQTPAADVTFSSQADDRRPGESSSIATSRGSGEKWSERGERLKERFLTPDRRSDEGSGGDSGSERKRLSRVRRSGGGGGGGFLRDGIFGNGTPKSSEKVSERKEGKRRSDNGMLQPEDRRLAGSRRSGESSARSSPLSREVSINQSATDSAQEPHTNSRPTSMDPAQLVQMALSLSESRKRHASGSLPMPMAAPRSRNVSGSAEKYGTVRTRAAERPRVGPSFDTYSPASSNHSREWQGPPSANAIDDNVLYTFSPATLARAEKARKYFELANEHRRLLQHLPPLKPDADADANYTFESRSSPGYAQPDIRRVRSNTTSRQELGRPYNLLQTLRNRRLRNRERRPFPVPPESFSDTQRVAAWMDDVEDAAKRPDYRAGDDIVRLPYFSTQPDELDGESNVDKGHRRTGTAGSVITRPENDWTVDPSERLADVYWTEQGDNKSLIENRRYQAIFPPRKNPDADDHRRSAELGLQQRKGYSEPPEEVSEQVEAPRKHRHVLSLHKADRTRHNRLSRLARSTSVSSTSSDEDRQSRSNARVGGAVDGLAPLNRHMDAMIAREQNGDISSPDLTSPDHWDSKHTPFAARGSKRMSGHRPANSLSVASDASQQRSKSADGRLADVPEGERPRFSFDSSPPSSPVMTDFVPSLAMDLSPPSKPRGNQSQKNKHRMLPIFRSRSKDRSTTEGRDFAIASESDRSREPSGNVIDPSRLSVESARPSELQRNKTSDSIMSGIHRRGTSRTQTTSDGSIKEPGSTVGRFFKGGRLAELVRADRSRYKNKEGSGSATDISVLPSDASDTEGSVDEPVRALASPNDSEPSPRTSIDRTRSKQKLHMPNLPTFKPTNGRDRPNSSLLTPVISNEDENNDHISRQAAARRETSRSPRIERLLPPRINLPDDNDQGLGIDSPAQTPDTFQLDRSRKSYGFLAPKGNGVGSAMSSNVSFDNTSNTNKRNGELPVSGLSRLNADGGRRHWSISDRGMRNQQRLGLLKNQRVSPRDLARAHALLLASGIKAHSLVTRANTPKEPAPTFLTAAAKTASINTPSIPLKETHLKASTILSSHLDQSFDSLAQVRQAYQSSTSQDLHTRLADLKSLAADKLTHLVHNSSDEADAFGVRLTTEQTLRIKQVDDAVDEILRLKRRQFRLARKAGFKVLEWMVLGLMWWVWFVVVCWKTVKRIILGVVRMVRWLLYF